MADLSTFARNLVYNFLLRPGVAVTRPTAIYVGLLNAGTEITGGGYTRVDVTSALSAPVDGVGANPASIVFPTPTGVWSTSGAPTTQFQLYDAATGGNAISQIKTLATARVIGVGETPDFAIGELDAAIS